ncbi:MAG: hypothetical protein ACI8PP_000394 [Candidatus Pseudothioglobus sp.]|jgi:hypothetical protein
MVSSRSQRRTSKAFPIELPDYCQTIARLTKALTQAVLPAKPEKTLGACLKSVLVLHNFDLVNIDHSDMNLIVIFIPHFVFVIRVNDEVYSYALR